MHVKQILSKAGCVQERVTKNSALTGGAGSSNRVIYEPAAMVRNSHRAKVNSLVIFAKPARLCPILRNSLPRECLFAINFLTCREF